MSGDSSQEAAAAIDQQMQGRFGLGTWDVIAVIAYFVVILSVGLIVSSKPQNYPYSIYLLAIITHFLKISYPTGAFPEEPKLRGWIFPCWASHVLAPRGFLTFCQQYRE